MKKWWSFIGCAALFCGCSTVSEYDEPSDSRAYAESRVNYAPAEKNKALRMESAGVIRNSNSDSAFFQESNRMMAYTAGFTVMVKNKDAGQNAMKKLAESYGGYLLSSARGNMVLKVPVKKADDFLKKSGNIGKISDFRISAEDLTDTITDLDVRLKNLRKLQTRLQELLAKAKK